MTVTMTIYNSGRGGSQVWLQQASIVWCFNTLGSYRRHLNVRALRAKTKPEGEEGKKKRYMTNRKQLLPALKFKKKKKKEYIICIYSFSSDSRSEHLVGVEGFVCGTLMHIQSIYRGLHHSNLEHRGCTFKSMHRPTMSNVAKNKKRKGVFRHLTLRQNSTVCCFRLLMQ